MSGSGLAALVVQMLQFVTRPGNNATHAWESRPFDPQAKRLEPSPNAAPHDSLRGCYRVISALARRPVRRAKHTHDDCVASPLRRFACGAYGWRRRAKPPATPERWATGPGAAGGGLRALGGWPRVWPRPPGAGGGAGRSSSAQRPTGFARNGGCPSIAVARPPSARCVRG